MIGLFDEFISLVAIIENKLFALVLDFCQRSPLC